MVRERDAHSLVELKGRTVVDGSRTYISDDLFAPGEDHSGRHAPVLSEEHREWWTRVLDVSNAFYDLVYKDRFNIAFERADHSNPTKALRLYRQHPDFCLFHICSTVRFFTWHIVSNPKWRREFGEHGTRYDLHMASLHSGPTRKVGVVVNTHGGALTTVTAKAVDDDQTA